MLSRLGWLSFIATQLVVLAALFGLWRWAGEIQWWANLNGPYLWRIVLFTFWQALLSTLISIAFAIPFARALMRRQFFGRSALIQLTHLAFVIPTMVAIFGIVAIHGRQGWANHLLETLGFEGQYYLYGLFGVLYAHVFFNLALATRIILQSLENLPAQSWRLGAQLGMSSAQLFRWVEWPAIRSVLPALAGVIFMLCFTSFAIVLALGGGPGTSTLEVAIYQAIRFDFDIERGVVLSVLQIAICVGMAILFSRFGQSFQYQAASSAPKVRYDIHSLRSKATDYTIILIASVFIISPLLAVAFRAINPSFMSLFSLPSFWQALAYSVFISLLSGLISVMISLPIAMLIKNVAKQDNQLKLKGIELGSVLILIVPPITLGMGLFLLLRQFGNALEYGLWVVILVNSLIAIPFVLRILHSKINTISQQNDRLISSLGMNDFQLMRLIYLPRLRQPLAFALAVSCTLALGDMGVIALFGTQDLSTLPLLIFRLMGAYKMDQAAGVALLLCALCILYFWGIERALNKPPAQTLA